jgi:hypothetical protein
MALCGIPRIDDLNSGNVADVIGPGDTDRESVGAIQGLLMGQGQKKLPHLLDSDYGIFGPLTTAAVQNFRVQQSLSPGDQVDSEFLQRLVQIPAVTPILSRPYLTLVLDFDYSGFAKILSVVAQMEGAGKFSALNKNSDKAGLSFGLIQWAQKPGRLAEILHAFFQAGKDDFIRIFGAGDANVAAGLIAHTKKVNGGIDRTTGKTTDPNFDLISKPWVSRFLAAAVWMPYQHVQMQTALADFSKSYTLFQRYAPQINTERAVGFTLDLANQFGDPGARSIYEKVYQDDMKLDDLLQAMADESVRRIQDKWKSAAKKRRAAFLRTAFLSDDLFNDSPNARPANAVA